MRFKTIIKIVSDANSRREALDLVEEYFAGNITSGVNMKCVTRPVFSKVKLAGVMALSLMVIVGVILTSQIKHPENILQTMPGVNAVQPPLNTSKAVKNASEFKKEWQDKQTKEALSRITR